MKICVFLTEDYKEHEYFDVDDNTSHEEIMRIINEKYPIWWYCDFLTPEQEKSMNKP